MLVELSIIPVGEGVHLSERIAEVMRIVDASGLSYQLTPAGTCIEGDWDEVMALVKQCHDQMRQHTSHVFTHIRIEDQAGAQNQLTENVASVADEVGKLLARA